MALRSFLKKLVPYLYHLQKNKVLDNCFSQRPLYTIILSNMVPEIILSYVIQINLIIQYLENNLNQDFTRGIEVLK